jgi:hypothetical protein
MQHWNSGQYAKLGGEDPRVALTKKTFVDENGITRNCGGFMYHPVLDAKLLRERRGRYLDHVRISTLYLLPLMKDSRKHAQEKMANQQAAPLPDQRPHLAFVSGIQPVDETAQSCPRSPTESELTSLTNSNNNVDDILTDGGGFRDSILHDINMDRDENRGLDEEDYDAMDITPAVSDDDNHHETTEEHDGEEPEDEELYNIEAILEHREGEVGLRLYA